MLRFGLRLVSHGGVSRDLFSLSSYRGLGFPLILAAEFLILELKRVARRRNLWKPSCVSPRWCGGEGFRRNDGFMFAQLLLLCTRFLLSKVSCLLPVPKLILP